MIVEHLRAKNFLKYTELKVEDLPTSGLIGISGVNESGKTAIFETVCFALFGRTFSLEHKKLVKAIKWGEDQAFVQLRFIANNGEHYTVVRTLNNIGRQGARLTHGADNEIISKGLPAVLAHVIQLCGFDFREFIDSIYLAQQEIGTPYTQGKTIKTIAGVTAMEKASSELSAEIRHSQTTIKETREQINEANERLQALNFDEDALARMEQENTQATQEIADTEQGMATRKEASSDLSQTIVVVEEQVNSFCQAGGQLNATAWDSPMAQLENTFPALQKAAQANGYAGETGLLSGLESFLSDVKPRILAFKGLLGQIDNYRQRLLRTVNETELPLPRNPSLPAQQALAQASVRKQQGQRTRARLGIFFTAICALALAGVWLLLAQFATTAIAKQLAQVLQSWLPKLDPQIFLYGALAGSAFFAVLLVIFLVRSYSLSSQIEEGAAQANELGKQIADIHERCQKLAELEDKPAPTLMNLLREMEEDKLHGALSSFVQGPGGALVSWSNHQEKLATALLTCQKEVEQLRQQQETTIVESVEQVSSLQKQIEQGKQTIEIENKRRKQAFEFMHMLTDLQSKIKDHAYQIKVRELGCELLAGAARQGSQRFNTDLRRFMSRVMPMMTEQRYQYLQLDEDLEVTVFSNEKQDFIGLEEISTGTQRQILLSLRLALSEALAEAAGPGGQCLVLDEPFAFFDETRIRRALEALPNVSSKLSQIWLVAQEFVTNDHFTRHIECERGAATLISTSDRTEETVEA